MDDKLTIVGPEPSGYENKTQQRKVNIEALLLMAKYDVNFQQFLLDDRKKALSESCIDFSEGEKMLLKSITNNQLKEHIKCFEIKGITKKSLKNWACAASIILLVSTTSLLNCGGIHPVTGAEPDTTDTNIVIDEIDKKADENPYKDLIPLDDDYIDNEK